MVVSSDARVWDNNMYEHTVKPCVELWDDLGTCLESAAAEGVTSCTMARSVGAAIL